MRREQGVIKSKGITGCLLATLLLLTLLAGCADGGDAKKSDESASDTSMSVVDDRGQAGSSQNAASQDVMVVSTEYGDLQYPAQWREYVEASSAKEGDSTKVSFTATVAGKTFPLFEIIIGEGDGEKAGTITDAAGTSRDVFVRLEEISGTEGLTEAEIDRLYAMQEGLNDLVDNLR